MSKLIVEVCEVAQINVHPNADALELVVVKGFQCVSKKGQFKVGDRVVYFPPSTMMKKELADQIGIANYLSWTNLKDEKGLVVKDAEGKPVHDLGAGGRTRSIKLRGEPSHGVLIPSPDPSWEVGRDVVEHYGVWKFIPPFRETAADAARELDLFDKFTEVENLRHFPDAFIDGEEIVATEKIHGSNCRIGLVTESYEFQGQNVTKDVFVAGSMEIRRKLPVKAFSPEETFDDRLMSAIELDYDADKLPLIPDLDQMQKNRYWVPLTMMGVRDLLVLVKKHKNAPSVVLYGETFGASVQKPFYYGSQDKLLFRAFGLKVNGKYLDYDEFSDLCKMFNVDVAPVLYRGAYSFDVLKPLANGQTTITAQKQIREGLVVVPAKERTHPKHGRLIMKLVGDDYLELKDSGKVSDYTEA